ncbi:ABC transporter permease [Bacteroidota bacterium]
MKTYIKLAWRNLWRNKRRTLITTASIVFSVFFAVIMRTMQEGSYDNMIETMVKFYSGYLQIQDSAYWDERTLDNSVEFDSALTEQVNAVEDILLVTPRLESFALSAYEEKSKPVMVFGIMPEEEDQIIKLSDKVIEGSFLMNNGQGVLISEGLARFLGIKLNDTLVMISQGYHGISAAGKYAISGIFKHPNPEFNNNMIYMSLPAAQEFYSAYGMHTSEVIMIKDHYGVGKVKAELEKFLPEDKVVMTWEEMQPEMKNMIEGDRQGGIVMLLILYLVIGFGIFGTAMMMINERKREFGVLNAVGMRKAKINIVLFYETILLGLVGSVLGLVISIPLTYYFYLNPLPLPGDMADAMMEYGMEPYYFVSMKASLFINQAILIFIMCVAVSFVSMITIRRMKMIDALRA